MASNADKRVSSSDTEHLSPEEKLTIAEKWWRDHYLTLERHGYLLRPRYRPGWVPSPDSGEPGLRWNTSDEFMGLPGPDVIDAKRTKDNTPVMIKRVDVDSDELAICRLLSSPQLCNEPHNLAVQLIDYIECDEEANQAFMVMPLLRPFNDPPFSTVNEVIDFVRQMLQGLIFLHELNIAHRDCYIGNIMIDANDLIPSGFHPRRWDKTPDLSRNIKPLRRCDVKKPVRYYFIDFGISSWFRDPKADDNYATHSRRPADKSLRRLVRGNTCQDPRPSEFNSSDPYDPFLLDICILGDLFTEVFVNKYTNLNFLRPLANRMRHTTPRKRPSEEESLKSFEEIVKTLGPTSRLWRLKPEGENVVVGTVRDVQSAVIALNHGLRRAASSFRKTGNAEPK